MGLFSTTNNYSGGKEYIPYEKSITIKEHRAPTDESVKLLNEFTEKARQNIIDTIHVKNNVIDCVVIYFQDDVMTDSIKYHLKFKLNGTEHKMKGQIDRMEFREVSSYQFRHEGVMMLVYKKYAELIAAELIKVSGPSNDAIIKMSNY